MAKYDPNVIEVFANRLYSRASFIEVAYAILGVLVGGVAGWAWDQALGSFVLSIIGLVIFGLIGYAIGTSKAFELRLQAQVALCQVQIERNTTSRSPNAATYPVPQTDGADEAPPREAVQQTCRTCGANFSLNESCPNGCAGVCRVCGASIASTMVMCPDCAVREARAGRV